MYGTKYGCKKKPNAEAIEYCGNLIALHILLEMSLTTSTNKIPRFAHIISFVQHDVWGFPSSSTCEQSLLGGGKGSNDEISPI